ncbi:MAG: Secretion system C-terminal sorting domain [Bacteroidetes bacterium]|nr:Secretion system C-terminal sorting domain [Bacteroidota bacterium]
MKKAGAILIILFSVFVLHINAQTLISQDFEGPLTGWYNEGTVTGSENGKVPYAGAGMLSMEINENLESPYFTLPAGSKNVSFQMNSYNPYSFLSFSIEVDLYQNGNPDLSLGTFTNVSAWNFYSINIPAGYSGSNYSVNFHVLNYSSSYNNLRFYLDDINVSTGLATSIKTESVMNDCYKILHDGSNIKKLTIQQTNDKSSFIVEVISMEGRTIYKKESSTDPQLEVDLSDVPTGIYNLRVSDNKNVFNKKIVF